MRKMRTINETVAALKSEDSETAITANFVRKLCKSNAIYCIAVGSKYLLDIENLIEYINGNSHLILD